MYGPFLDMYFGTSSFYTDGTEHYTRSHDCFFETTGVETSHVLFSFSPNARFSRLNIIAGLIGFSLISGTH